MFFLPAHAVYGEPFTTKQQKENRGISNFALCVNGGEINRKSAV